LSGACVGEYPDGAASPGSELTSAPASPTSTVSTAGADGLVSASCPGDACRGDVSTGMMLPCAPSSSSFAGASINVGSWLVSKLWPALGSASPWRGSGIASLCAEASGLAGSLTSIVGIVDSEPVHKLTVSGGAPMLIVSEAAPTLTVSEPASTLMASMSLEGRGNPRPPSVLVAAAARAARLSWLLPLGCGNQEAVITRNPSPPPKKKFTPHD
jgi:hypothetical protein